MWNHEEWAFAKAVTEHGDWNYMDVRHVQFIYDLLMACNFKNIFEIGCNNGFITSALVQAKRDGKTYNIDTCDIVITDNVRKIVGSDANILECRSVDAFKPEHDLVIVDGAHDMLNVSAELDLILKYKTSTVLAHDVLGLHAKSKNISPYVAGSVFLRETLMDHPDYKYRHDSVSRPNERTDRGLLFATCSDTVWQASEKPWKDLLK